MLIMHVFLNRKSKNCYSPSLFDRLFVFTFTKLAKWMECSIESKTELLVDWLIVWKMQYTRGGTNHPTLKRTNSGHTVITLCMHSIDRYSKYSTHTHTQKTADRSLSMSPCVQFFSCLSAAFYPFAMSECGVYVLMSFRWPRRGIVCRKEKKTPVFIQF